MEKLLNAENVWNGERECDLVEGALCRIWETVVKALKHSKMIKERLQQEQRVMSDMIMAPCVWND